MSPRDAADYLEFAYHTALAAGAAILPHFREAIAVEDKRNFMGYDPVTIAGQYVEAGAAAVSVLTEPGFFDGALEHLVAVRAAHPTLPLLRKDFTIDEYQIAEAAVAGASAVLLGRG